MNLSIFVCWAIILLLAITWAYIAGMNAERARTKKKAAEREKADEEVELRAKVFGISIKLSTLEQRFETLEAAIQPKKKRNVKQ